jgi:hypothetical protein
MSQTKSLPQIWDEAMRAEARDLAQPLLEQLKSNKDRPGKPNKDRSGKRDPEKLLKRLFEYFLQNAGSSPLMMQPKQIVASVFNNESGSSGRLKVYVCRLRAELDRYFRETTVGRARLRRLEVPNRSEGDAYELRLIANARKLPVDLRFWDPYTAEDSNALILYAHPLFFWDKENRVYLRFLDINENEEDHLEIDRKVKALVDKFGLKAPSTKLEACFHYISAGDSKMIRHLQHWFRTHWFEGTQLPLRYRKSPRLPLEVKSSRETTGDEVYNNNVIILGNARISSFIGSFQKEFERILEYRLDADLVTKISKEAQSQVEFHDAEAGRGPAYVLVTRIPNLNSEKQVTIVAANNGVAGAKVVEELTSQKFLKELFDFMRWDTDGDLPDHFQIVFEVTTTRTQAFNVKPHAAFSKPR